MSTHEEMAAFRADYRLLTPAQRAAFLGAQSHFLAALRYRAFRASLRVKKLQGHDDTWELTWAPDGRATFSYGPRMRAGEPHIIWRRIGAGDSSREGQ